MTWKLIPGAIIVLAGLAGCASNTGDSQSYADTSSAASSSRTCDSDRAESAVGQKVSPALVEKFRRLANAETARALRPNDVITTEYAPQRLNLKVDDQDVVISVNCS